MCAVSLLFFAIQFHLGNVHTAQVRACLLFVRNTLWKIGIRLLLIGCSFTSGGVPPSVDGSDLHTYQPLLPLGLSVILLGLSMALIGHDLL